MNKKNPFIDFERRRKNIKLSVVKLCERVGYTHRNCYYQSMSRGSTTYKRLLEIEKVLQEFETMQEDKSMA